LTPDSKRAEFAAVLMHITNLWGLAFDEGKAEAWFNLLGKFKTDVLILALNTLAQKLKFAPSISEIVEQYGAIVTDVLRRRKQLRIEMQQADKDYWRGLTNYCDICRCSGIVEYTAADGYVYAARCTCTRGKDLRRWSESQINREKDIYYPDVSDVLTDEQIMAIKIKNTYSDAVRRPITEVYAEITKLYTAKAL